MNLAALNYIIRNNPELIEENVVSGNPAAAIAAAKILVSNGGDVAALSDAQRFHAENHVRPLVENVACDGVWGSDEESGEDGCMGTGRISDEDLADCYASGDMLCQECQHISHKMENIDD